MSAASQTWTRPTFEVLLNAISLPALESGVMPSDLQDGPMLDLFGREVVLAPVSQPLEKAKGLQTLVTSGHIGHASSGSAALQQSLENRLLARLDTAGSTLFTLTWKRRRTPLGRRYLERAASGRRTSGNACTSVPTPRKQDDHPTLMGHNTLNEKGRMVTADGWDYGLALCDTAQLASVATPRSEDSQCTGAHRGTADTLHSQANLCSVASPSARDYKDSPGMSETGVDPDGSIRTRLDQLPRQAQLADSGPTATGGTPATKSTGQLNPEYSRWLQGLPIEFSNCADTATASFRESRRDSLKRQRKDLGS